MPGFQRLLSVVVFSVVLGATAKAHRNGGSGCDPLLLRAARGEAVERTPVWMMRQAGRHMRVYRDLCSTYPTFRERSEIPEIATEISLQPWRAYGVDGVILFSDILTPLPAMGIEFDVSEEGKITISPIRTTLDFQKITNHPFDPENSLSFVGKALTNIRKTLRVESTETERPAVLGFIGCPFTICTYLVEGQTGTSNDFQACRKMINENPKLMKEILEMLVERLATYAVYQVESGAELIQLFDSWAGWLTREEFQLWAFPYQKRVVSLIKERLTNRDVPLILYMAPLANSKEGAFLDLMADTGVSVVSIDHTVDFKASRRRLDEVGCTKIVLQGNMDPTILCEGPLERIQSETVRILKDAQVASAASVSSKGEDEANSQSTQRLLRFQGHIMNLGHGIDKNTPEDHASGFIQAVKKFEIYPRK